MKSHEYIDLAKKKENITSYRLSLNTGISQSALSQYKNENRVMDDYACFKIAEILCIDPKKIIARANAEREDDIEKREFWQGKVKEYGFITHKMSVFLPSIMAIIGILALTLRDKMSAIGYEIYDLYLIVFSDLNIFVGVFDFLLLYRLCAVICIIGRTPPQFCKA